ncbi:phosphatidate cytidylyltransferase [Burkholderiaceae bacterium DAT-1]|nr:phosphatidate cytidylyltransferase [Burkholderiaceae bacterium DAT-1]
MLKARIITALVLLPIVLACLFAGSSLLWGGFALFALTVGAWEWGRFARLESAESKVFIASFALMGGALLALPPAITVVWALVFDIFALVFWLAVIPLWLARKWALAPKWRAAIVGMLVLMSALSAVTRLHALTDGPLVLLMTLAIAWIADVSAYFAGRAFGKRKLAPSISPGKSWEGVYGALIAVTLYALALHQLNVPVYGKLPLYVLIPVFLLLTAVSVMGDLFESLLKRMVGMKDSSQLLPGHGGVLDRVDSLLALAPLSVSLLFFYARFAP